MADAASKPATSPVWDSTETIAFTVTGPFQTAFSAAYAGLPDGINPPVRVKDPFAGTLQYTGDAGPVVLQTTLKVRGNSSLQECAFPKLKVTVFDDAERAASIFYKAKRTKIGTHCDDRADDDRGVIGRLRNQKATFREAFVYEVMRQLQLPTKWARPARITYVDTSPGTSDVGWTVERDGFIFDNAKNVAKRHDALLRADEDPWTATQVQSVDRDQAAKLYFLQALFGNWDWRLAVDPATSETGPPWNVHVMTLSNGTHVPFAYDFDLSSAVTGEFVRESQLPTDLYPGEALLFRQAAYYLLPTKDEFTGTRRTQIAAFFVAAEATLRATLASYPMDADGRENMTAHLDAFYDVLAREYP